MTRQAYILEDHALVVFWTPKAACTTVAHEIASSILGKRKQDKPSTGQGDRAWLKENGFWRSGMAAKAACETRGFRSIGLIRDPYDRLISAYLNKFVRRPRGDIRSVTDLEPFARSFYLNAFLPSVPASVGGDGAFRGLSFREFVLTVCRKIEERGLEEPMLDHHWNTQIPFSFLEQAFKYDELFGLPSADAFFERLGELTGSAMKNSKHNRTKYVEQNDRPLQDMLSIHLIGMQNIDSNSFGDAGLRDTVRRAFDVDYHYLNTAR